MGWDEPITPKFAYIDALRGYAILGVIAVHTSQLFPQLEWPVQTLADQGARGVQLFFVVSAFTLTCSWRARADFALPFWIRRAFRIVPMFWLAIIYYAVTVGIFRAPLHWGPQEITWTETLASITLTHGLSPATVGSMVPGGWSIAAEAGFYAIFPLLMMAIRSWRAAVIALLISAAAISIVSPFIHGNENLWLMLPFQLPAFLVGILLFYLLQDFSGRVPRTVIRLGLLTALAIGVVLPFAAPFLQGRIHWAAFHLFFGNPLLSYSILFSVVVFSLAQGIGLRSVNAAIRHVGKVSYGAYFWHFAILELLSRAVDLSGGGWLSFLASFLVASTLAVVGATLTFHLVEEPFLRLGHRLARQLPHDLLESKLTGAGG